MSETKPCGDTVQPLGAGTFYGAIQSRREQCDAIFTDLCHQSPKKLPAHSHQLPFFAVLLEGYYGERYGRQQKQFGPCTIMFRPAEIPHEDEIGPTGVKFFEIEMRPSWRKRLEHSAAPDVGCDDCNGGQLFWLGMKLFCEIHGSADDLVVEELLLHLLTKASGPRCERGEQHPGWLARVIEKLMMEHSEKLTLDDLSAEAGVHPVHLSRVFRKCVGEGIGEHVRRLRIRSACEQMMNPEIPMAEISLAAGFADQSHFTRSFRKVTGMTPARFRAIVADGASIARPACGFDALCGQEAYRPNMG